MVSKIFKKSASDDKPIAIKRCRGIRRLHRLNCFVKKAAATSSVVLTRIGSKKGFKILHKAPAQTQPEPETRIQGPLPPLISPEKLTVILDLDETLVHSVTGPPPKRFDFVLRPTIRGKVMTFYVVKRPGVDGFLEKLAEKYEVVVFTAGLREYATLVLDRLDRKRVISQRIYRDGCKEVGGKFVKDLSMLGRDLSRVVIVDDNPNAYCFHPENAVPIWPFVDDVADRELWRLLEFFEDEGTRCCTDIRDAVKQFFCDGGLVSSSSSSDDDDDDDDDVLEELRDAKSKLPTFTVSKPCSIVGLHKVHPFGTPDFHLRTNMVMLFSLFLILIHVILCFRR